MSFLPSVSLTTAVRAPAEHASRRPLHVPSLLLERHTQGIPQSAGRARQQSGTPCRKRRHLMPTRQFSIASIIIAASQRLMIPCSWEPSASTIPCRLPSPSAGRQRAWCVHDHCGTASSIEHHTSQNQRSCETLSPAASELVSTTRTISNCWAEEKCDITDNCLKHEESKLFLKTDSQSLVQFCTRS